jgi:DnaA family protein
MIKFRVPRLLPSSLKQLLLDFARAPAPTFENYFPGANTELVHVLQRAAAGDSPDRVVYVWGESGAGKTHLLKAFARACGEGRARYLPAVEWTSRGQTEALALDGAEHLSDAQQVELFNAFNERAFALLVVSASAAPRDVALRRDLSTRLATGLTYRVLTLTDAEKRAALAAHARSRGFDLSDEVSAYLLTHARRDMGSLVAALDALDRYSLETGRAVTVPLLKAALESGRAESQRGLFS